MMIPMRSRKVLTRHDDRDRNNLVADAAIHANRHSPSIQRSKESLASAKAVAQTRMLQSSRRRSLGEYIEKYNDVIDVYDN